MKKGRDIKIGDSVYIIDGGCRIMEMGMVKEVYLDSADYEEYHVQVGFDEFYIDTDEMLGYTFDYEGTEEYKWFVPEDGDLEFLEMVVSDCFEKGRESMKKSIKDLLDIK